MSVQGLSPHGLNLKQFSQEFRAKTGPALLSSLDACVRCGVCAESCHYYQADPRPEHVPAYRAEAVRRILRTQDPWTRWFPGWFGAEPRRGRSDEEMLRALGDVIFGTCTQCRRCTLSCPMGVDTGTIVRTARGVLARHGLIPEGLKATVDAHLKTGNNMAVSREDFLDTLQWMEEQLQSDTGDPQARIPVNKQGARVLYTLNPREVKYFPLTILAAAKILYAAQEDWTFSTEAWDGTNYGLFSGEDDKAAAIARRLEAEAVRLGVQEVVMTECGHGYRSFRWEGPNWLGHPYPFRVRSFVELMAEYLGSGRIRLNPAANSLPVTYHDPCNLARNGGIIEEPRFLLSRAVREFREMTPNRKDNYCCGGGGGMLAMTEYSQRRLQAGQAKARQIAASGARVVVTSCHNCVDQLNELNRHYQLKVKVHNLCEIVADALVLAKAQRPAASGAAAQDA